MKFTDEVEAKVGKVFKRSALRLHDGEEVFRRVLGCGRFKTALEIGTYRGASAACMARLCEHVITIDLRDGMIERFGEKWDRQSFWATLGITNIELHLVADNDEKAALINGLDFNFAFIDGAHDETVRQDFDLVKRCGTVLFHDYTRHARGPSYVADLVDSLPKKQVTVVNVIFALWQSKPCI